MALGNIITGILYEKDFDNAVNVAIFLQRKFVWNKFKQNKVKQNKFYTHLIFDVLAKKILWCLMDQRITRTWTVVHNKFV